MLIDANILLYAVDAESPFHAVAARWLADGLRGDRRLGFAWQSLVAFVRIATNPRAAEQPLSPVEAWSHVQRWLETDVAWIPLPTERHARILGELVQRHDLRGNLVSDAALATLAMEHGLTIVSADSDFGLFPEVAWHNPIGGR